MKAWVHVFPEGRIRQEAQYQMRYFKWGVSRLVLESENTPIVVPIFHTGLDEIMNEERKFPRFLPRLGKTFEITFGDPIEMDVIEGFRDRWNSLKNREGPKSIDASKLRSQVAKTLRDAVNEIGIERGLPADYMKDINSETYREVGEQEIVSGKEAIQHVS